MEDLAFEQCIYNHIRDTSLGIVNDKLFNVQSTCVNKLEVNRIYQFCKGFEMDFAEEITRLLEYKVELTERSTYFLDGVCQKNYLCNFSFMSATKWQG